MQFFYQKIYKISEDESERIENKVVDISDPVEKRKLEDFDKKGKTDSGKNHFFMAVEFFENNGPYYSDGDEHSGVSDNVEQSSLFFRIIKKVHKRNEIDSWRKNPLKAEKQRLNMSFDFFKREEGNAHYYHYADIDEQKHEFAFPIKFFAYKTSEHSEKDP